ncbi:phosphonate ABC transporter ATP-binding protein [Breoghania sp.]|uniref:phosphonate ABC transporter ATP-binding protein n=1 Tax=Breoghania sp. TaxID=2065378 RepID=UPI002AA619AF|nr:phosphonate ABC transporter ATP-binding protein [Breoghania sp.]
MVAVKIDGLKKTFGRTRALCGVSVEIPAGEMVALIGASGSGKSTLIRHIAGLERGDEGRITIHDREIQSNGRLANDARDLRRSIGVVFQQFNLVGRLSVLTNVLIGFLGQIGRVRGTLGFFTAEEKQIAMQALHRVGISDHARQRASTLSGGQKQRAAIARALVQGAKLMLADEPIASLDPASARRVMEILGGINKEDGMTVIVSLHQVEYARRYCPRTIAMKDGEVVYDGPSTALNTEFLKELYGEASEELILPDAPVSAPASAPFNVPVRERPVVVNGSGAAALAPA